MKDIINILNEYELNVNINKTKSWYNNVGNGIKTVKTIRYLGINLRSNAKDFDRLGIEPKIKANVNKLKYVAKRNPMKGYSLYEAYIDSILKYQQKAKGGAQGDYLDHLRATSIKKLFGLVRNFPIFLAMSIPHVVGEIKRQNAEWHDKNRALRYFRSLCNLMYK